MNEPRKVFEMCNAVAVSGIYNHDRNYALGVLGSIVALHECGVNLTRKQQDAFIASIEAQIDNADEFNKRNR